MALKFANPVAIHVIWHPRSVEAKALADAIFAMFRSNSAQLEGGLGIPVYFYSEPQAKFTDAPPELGTGTAHRHVVVILIDENLIDAVDGTEDWRTYLNSLENIRDQQQEPVQFLPVSLSDEAIDFCNREALPNAIRWHYWIKQTDREKIDRLAVHVIPVLFDSLREQAGGVPDPIARKRVSLFLSHAKADGRNLALAFRETIQAIPGLGDFFDEVDILPGEDFATVLAREIGRAAILVIQTNAYASRDWCCWEVVAGKRLNIPIVAANCIEDREERAFPYLGNVPSIRVNDPGGGRALEVVRRLLEEVLRELVWRCMVKQYRQANENLLKGVLDTWRSPELVWLMLSEEINKSQSEEIIVLYPDPPLGRNERSIMDRYKPRISLLTPTELMAR